MAALDNFEHAVGRQSYAQKLRDIAATCGYRVDHIATRRVRGWPEKSKKPWHILYGDGTLCASFATLDSMEKNLRGRCGC